MKVKILIGHYRNQIGVLEDKIPNSDWFNVRVNKEAGGMRLVLTEEEFEVLD